MSHPLDGCREKIKRANQHIREFHDDIIVRRKVSVPSDAIRAQYRTHARNPLDIATWRSEVIFTLRETPQPLDWSFTLLAGESIHHLRSVLDHLVYQLVIEKTKHPPTFNSAFPIVGRRNHRVKPTRTAAQDYEAKVGRLKHDISSSAEAIIHSLQPYQRGATYYDDPLWLLSELDNAYKHRLLLLTVHGVSNYFGTVTIGDVVLRFNFTPQVVFEDGAEIGRLPLNDTTFVDTEVRVDGDLVLNVAFDEILGRKYVPVIPCLAQLANYVIRVVDSFSAEFA